MEEIGGRTYDCIVIGAGMSGISFAHHLGIAGEDVLLIDRNDRPGGQVYTHRSAAFPGFWNEMGPHTCYNSYVRMLSMLKESGLADSMLETEKLGYAVYAEGRIGSISARIKKLPLALNSWRVFFAKKEGRTVREYFEPIVGRGNYSPLFSNAFRAVICQKADDYPAEIFLKRRAERLKDVPRKYMFRGGLSPVLEKIVAADGIAAMYGTEVSGISRSGEVFTVATAGGGELSAHRIAIAVDPVSAAHLLRALEPGVSELLGSISPALSESRSVIVRKDALSLKPVAFILPMSDDLYSVVSRDPVGHPDLRGFTFHFEQGRDSEGRQRETICEILGIVGEDILEEKHMTHILPALRPQHLDMEGRIGSASRDKRIYYLGNYYYGLSLEDCVHRSTIEFERYKRSK